MGNRLGTEKPPENALCHKCQQQLAAGDRAIRAANRFYHADCFVCVSCSTKMTVQYCEENSELYCKDCWIKTFAPKCHACQKPIQDQYEKMLTKAYHPECAKCSKCQAALTGDQYYPFNNAPYCYDCHWKVRMEADQQSGQIAVIKKKG